MTATLNHRRVLIVGNPEPAHLGAHLLAAATALGVPATICDVRQAFEGSFVRRKLAWWMGHRPAQLRRFSRVVASVAREFRASCVLATGLAPIDAATLRGLRAAGVARLNFLTDDPWNPVHRAPWFLDALPHYDHVFSPRTANLDDLRRVGGFQVSYLPFGYARPQHFIERPSNAEAERFVADLLFAGGADPDRVDAVRPFIEAGFNVALYGGYWDRYRLTRPFARGFLDPCGLRKAVAAARVSLCLVRRANRDGHSMRSFEVPAMGGCMLIEDTDDHRRIFGADHAAVTYFNEPNAAVARLQQLLAATGERQRLAEAAHAVVVGSPNAYEDRLVALLQAA